MIPLTSLVLVCMCAALVCAAADDRVARGRGVVTGVAMVTAMADVMITTIVSPILWMVMLTGLGIWAGALPPQGRAPHDIAMQAHRAISCIAMAAMLVLPTNMTGQHHHGGPLPIAAMFVVGLVAGGMVITAKAVRASRTLGAGPQRTRRLLTSAEPTLMGAAMAAMFA